MGLPGALLGVVGGSGVLKGSKETGLKLKEVVLEDDGLGVMGVLFSRLEHKSVLIHLPKKQLY